MPDPTQPARLAIFKPSAATGDRLPHGAVLIVRPLTEDEANLWETGPMFRVRYLATGREYDAYLDELYTPAGDDRPIEWGEWWESEDHGSSGARQFWIETGEWQTRRLSFEFSVGYERRVLAAEAHLRRVRGAVA